MWQPAKLYIEIRCSGSIPLLSANPALAAVKLYMSAVNMKSNNRLFDTDKFDNEGIRYQSINLLQTIGALAEWIYMHPDENREDRGSPDSYRDHGAPLNS